MSSHPWFRGPAGAAAATWPRAAGALLVLLLPAVQPARGGYVGGFGQGLSARVYAVTLYEGSLVAAGVFDADAGGTVTLGKVARFCPQGWQPLGPAATHGEVRCLLSWGRDLVAGGDFFRVGDVPARSIARWNGASWAPVGGGIRGGVRVLAAYGGDLIAGGDFSVAGGTVCHGLARWDGVQWNSMGLGRATGQVRALAEFGGSLYVGGTHIEIPGVLAGGHALVRWDGIAWHAVGAGFKHGELVDVPSGVTEVATPAGVLALVEYDGRLVIGGQFRRAFNGSTAVSADGLMQWDGSQFLRMGEGSLGQTDVGGVPGGSGTRSAFALAVHEGLLVVAGAFQGVVVQGGGTISGSNLAVWDGTAWQQPDSPWAGADVTYAALSLPATVALGGCTGALGGEPLGYLARWSRGATSVLDPPPGGFTAALAGAFPNPFNPQTTIRFQLNAPGRCVLSIHDAAGRTVAMLEDAWLLAGVHAVSWNGEDARGCPVASGVYTIRLGAGGSHSTSRVTLAR